MNIVGLCGSLRQDSYNQQLLHAAKQRCETHDAIVTQGDIGALPHYNSDLETDGLPESVETLKQLVQDADALLIVSPEYNYSVPGPLKNAIDWLSRPAYQSVLAKLPTGILSASMSPIGGARMQGHLKNILAGTLTPVAPLPEFVLATAQNAFDESGALTSEPACKALDNYVGKFLAWASVD